MSSPGWSVTPPLAGKDAMRPRQSFASPNAAAWVAMALHIASVTPVYATPGGGGAGAGPASPLPDASVEKRCSGVSPQPHCWTSAPGAEVAPWMSKHLPEVTALKPRRPLAYAMGEKR